MDVKQRAATWSVVASAAVATSKFAVALATGSLALLSDALHSLLDVGATLMTLFAVRWSAKPADEEHPYGHGKIESVTALIEVGLLIAVSIYVVIEAGNRLFTGSSDVEFSWVAVAVLVGAILIDFFRARALRAVAAETSSHALESNALHFSADMWQSIFVLVGFAAVYMGFPQGDALAALAVAGFIGVAALGLGRRTVDVLMDAAPEGATDRIRAAAEGVRGVVAIERVRVRKVGAVTLGEITVTVPRTLSPDRIIALKAQVEAAIDAVLPGAEVTVTANPRALDDETVLERVLLVAAARRLPVHHVTVQQLEGQLSIALDLEVDGRMSLDAAHTIATRLEAAIRDDFGPDTEVETHIEPLQVRRVEGRDVPEERQTALAHRIAEIAAKVADVGDIHDVRVRETDEGLVVLLHCLADPKLSVRAVHRAVDTLEQRIRKEFAEVARVISHAEPRR